MKYGISYIRKGHLCIQDDLCLEAVIAVLKFLEDNKDEYRLWSVCLLDKG